MEILTDLHPLRVTAALWAMAGALLILAVVLVALMVVLVQGR